MPFWKLTPINPHLGDFRGEIEKAFGFVIRAQTEHQARTIANAHSGVEKGPSGTDHYGQIGGNPWLDNAKTHCVQVAPDGPDEVVLRSASTDQVEALVDPLQPLKRIR
ncbi:hypothetical protein KF840_19335 [bacterium]|nr:hypothetical protein [bacterium]